MFFNRSSEKKGKKVTEGVFYFGESGMLDCNQYILQSKSGKLTMIDAGNGNSLNGLISGMEKLGMKIQDLEKVVITHEHVDHLVGIYTLKDRMGDKMPELIAFGDTADIIKNAEEDKVFPRGLGITASNFGVNMQKLDCFKVKEGDTIDCGDFKLNVYETPGHSEGSGSFVEESLGILFPGDVVFPGGSFGRYDFPGGNKSILKSSIQKLSQLKSLSYLCAGHMSFEGNAVSQIKNSLKMIDYF